MAMVHATHTELYGTILGQCKFLMEIWLRDRDVFNSASKKSMYFFIILYRVSHNTLNCLTT